MAIETELGLGLKGTKATLAERINISIKDNGVIKGSTKRVTTTYLITATDEVVFCNTNSGDFTVTLPAGVEGTHYKIINCGSSGNTLTVDGDSAELVYGETTQDLSDGDVIDLHYNTTEGWW